MGLIVLTRPKDLKGVCCKGRSSELGLKNIGQPKMRRDSFYMEGEE